MSESKRLKSHDVSLEDENKVSQGQHNSKLRTVRSADSVETLQKLPYFLGISADSVGSEALSMHLVVIPPGAKSEPHVHVGYETAIYLLEGSVKTFYGPNLANEVVNVAGEFVYIAPGCPHQAMNVSQTQPAKALVARNDSAESERTVLYES